MYKDQDVNVCSRTANTTSYAAVLKLYHIDLNVTGGLRLLA